VAAPEKRPPRNRTGPIWPRRCHSSVDGVQRAVGLADSGPRRQPLPNQIGPISSYWRQSSPSRRARNPPAVPNFIPSNPPHSWCRRLASLARLTGPALPVPCFPVARCCCPLPVACCLFSTPPTPLHRTCTIPAPCSRPLPALSSGRGAVCLKSRPPGAPIFTSPPPPAPARVPDLFRRQSPNSAAAAAPAHSPQPNVRICSARCPLRIKNTRCCGSHLTHPIKRATFPSAALRNPARRSKQKRFPPPAEGSPIAAPAAQETATVFRFALRKNATSLPGPPSGSPVVICSFCPLGSARS